MLCARSSPPRCATSRRRPTGDGTQTRSLCYVYDEINGLLLVSDEVGPVNVGKPREGHHASCRHMIRSVIANADREHIAVGVRVLWIRSP